MRAQDSVVYSNFSATQGPFQLQGGKYALITKTGTPSSSNHVDLTRVAADGSTAVVVIAGSQSATSAYATGDLPPGQYSLTVSGTLSGIYAEVVRIPTD